MAATRAVFGIEGQAAQAEVQAFRKYGFFEGTYAAILEFIKMKGISPHNIIGSIGYNSTTTNYYIFYWK